MGRDYKVIDADGHILEPVDLWDNYMDPQYRERAPRMFTDTDGKDRLNIDGKIIGGPRGLGFLGGIGLRDGRASENMKFPASGSFQGRSPTPSSPGPCAGPITVGWRTTVHPTRIDFFLSPCCRCNQLTTPLKKCALLTRNWACAVVFCGRTRTMIAWRVTPTTTPSGLRRRHSISASASTKAGRAACRRWALIALPVVAPSTLSRTPWK